MKTKRFMKYISLALFIVMALSMSSTAFAAESSEVDTQSTINSNIVFDGLNVELVTEANMSPDDITSFILNPYSLVMIDLGYLTAGQNVDVVLNWNPSTTLTVGLVSIAADSTLHNLTGFAVRFTQVIPASGNYFIMVMNLASVEPISVQMTYSIIN